MKEFKESVNDVVDDPKSLYKLDLTTRDPTDAASHDDGYVFSSHRRVNLFFDCNRL